MISSLLRPLLLAAAFTATLAGPAQAKKITLGAEEMLLCSAGGATLTFRNGEVSVEARQRGIGGTYSAVQYEADRDLTEVTVSSSSSIWFPVVSNSVSSMRTPATTRRASMSTEPIR